MGKMADAAGDRELWLDMESSLRTKLQNDGEHDTPPKTGATCQMPHPLNSEEMSLMPCLLDPHRQIFTETPPLPGGDLFDVAKATTCIRAAIEAGLKHEGC